MKSMSPTENRGFLISGIDYGTNNYETTDDTCHLATSIDGTSWQNRSFTGCSTSQGAPVSQLSGVSAGFPDGGAFVIGDPEGQAMESGGMVFFTVNLGFAPSSSVSIPVTVNDSTVGTVSPSQLTFSPSDWNSEKTVTITGVDDQQSNGNRVVNAILGKSVSDDSLFSGLDPPDVEVVIEDDDHPPSEGIFLTTYGFSEDGIRWTRNSNSSSFNVKEPIAYHHGRFVTLGTQNNKTVIYYSDNGTAWTESNIIRDDSNYGTSIHSIAYGNGVWVGVGEKSVSWSLDDGQTWRVKRNENWNHWRKVALEMAVLLYLEIEMGVQATHQTPSIQ